MAIIDYVFIGIIVLGGIVGVAKGFFKTLISFFGWFLTLLITFLLAKTIANALLTENVVDWLIKDGSVYDRIYNIGLMDNLKKLDMESIRSAVASGSTDEQVKAMLLEKADGIMKLFVGLIQTAVCKDVYLSSSLENVGQVFAIEITYNAFVITVGVVFFIVLRILIGVLTALANKKKPENISVLSRVGGLALGLVKGAVYACLSMVLVIYIAAVPIESLQSFSDKLNEQLTQSVIDDKVNEASDKVLNFVLSRGDDGEEDKRYMAYVEKAQKSIQKKAGESSGGNASGDESGSESAA